MKDKVLNKRVVKIIRAYKKPAERKMINGVPQYNDGKCTMTDSGGYPMGSLPGTLTDSGGNTKIFKNRK